MSESDDDDDDDLFDNDKDEIKEKRPQRYEGGKFEIQVHADDVGTIK